MATPNKYWQDAELDRMQNAQKQLGALGTLLGSTGVSGASIDRNVLYEYQKRAAQMNTANYHELDMYAAQMKHVAYDLTKPEWQASVSTLCDMWHAAFGDSWVGTEDFKRIGNESFWQTVRSRLYKTRHLEEVANIGSTLFRIID